MVVNEKTLFIAGGLLLGAVVAWVSFKGPAEIGAAFGGAVVSAADGAASGTVKGIGSLFGIPDTDATRCKAARAAGSAWDASKYCPAVDFLRWVFE